MRFIQNLNIVMQVNARKKQICCIVLFQWVLQVRSMYVGYSYSDCDIEADHVMRPLGNTTAVQTLEQCNWKHQHLFDIYSLYT